MLKCVCLLKAAGRAVNGNKGKRLWRERYLHRRKRCFSMDCDSLHGRHMAMTCGNLFFLFSGEYALLYCFVCAYVFSMVISGMPGIPYFKKFTNSELVFFA